MSDSLDTNIVVSDSTKRTFSRSKTNAVSSISLKKKITRGRRMDQLVKCLLHKHENPSLGSQASYEKLGTDMHLNPSTRQREPRRSQGSVGQPV